MNTTTTATRAIQRSDHGEPQRFRLYDRVIGHSGSTEVQQLLADAHADHIRPLCLCRVDGVPMYVAKVGPAKYVMKRMPDTGLDHDPRCASYLPPDGLSGLGSVLGGAINEEADTGLTSLRLGFRLSKTERSTPASTAGSSVGDSVSAEPNKLTLRAVLHYLWQEADLNTWTPGMTGKRTWGVVSYHLRQAALGKFAKGKPLAARLFVPEVYNSEKKSEIESRRLSAWEPARPASGSAQQFMMLIGELKDITPSRFGHKLIIKHLPDAPLMIDQKLHDRLHKRFGNELGLWYNDQEAHEDSPKGHMIVIATFSVGRGGLASAEEVSLVMTDSHWLPYESQADKILLDTAIEERRRFTKSLRYNLEPDAHMASLVLTDTPTPTAAFLLSSSDELEAVDELAAEARASTWAWVVGQPMPPLPTPGQRL